MKGIENLILNISDEEKIHEYTSSEDIEGHIRSICEQVLLSENIINFGNSAYVFRDPNENGLCYKKNKPLATPLNSISDEARFLDDVYGIHDKVKTPYPIAVAKAIIVDPDTGRRTKREILVMEELNATRLSDIIEGKIPGYTFPLYFDLNTFFHYLREFVIKMHESDVYHCDLFARNIMIDNETGLPCVIDFGEARYPSIDDNIDVYGRPAVAELPDIDLRNIDNIEQSVIIYFNQFLNK